MVYSSVDTGINSPYISHSAGLALIVGAGYYGNDRSTGLVKVSIAANINNGWVEVSVLYKNSDFGVYRVSTSSNGTLIITPTNVLMGLTCIYA